MRIETQPSTFPRSSFGSELYARFAQLPFEKRGLNALDITQELKMNPQNDQLAPPPNTFSITDGLVCVCASDMGGERRYVLVQYPADQFSLNDSSQCITQLNTMGCKQADWRFNLSLNDASLDPQQREKIETTFRRPSRRSQQEAVAALQRRLGERTQLRLVGK